MTDTKKSQLERFKEAARQIETDDYEKRLKKLAKQMATPAPKEHE